MVRRVFYSFHFDADAWRAAQVRNAGALEGNTPVTDNEWEAIKKGGDAAIKDWIDKQLVGRSCAVVLIGAGTAGRRWIDYEICKSWNANKGLMGIHIHRLLDKDGRPSSKGVNPFSKITLRSGGSLAKLVPVYDPQASDSRKAHRYITEHLASWVEDAIERRRK